MPEPTYCDERITTQGGRTFVCAQQSHNGNNHTFVRGMPGLPVGTVVSPDADSGLSIVALPNGALLAGCGGTVYVRDYPELFQILHNTFGPAPEGEFQLPDLCTRTREVFDL